MRTIKFRAWDKYEKKWVPVNFGFDIDNTGFMYPVDTRPPTDLVLMQFTGLFDRNGKEIYESDIVEIKDKGNITQQSSYDMYEVRWVNDNSWNISNRKDVYEVIGNIYSNPELLQSQ